MHRMESLGHRSWILIVVFLIVASVAAAACSCGPEADIEQALGDAAAVFAGRVIALELVPDPNPAVGISMEQLRVTVSVHSTWKGEIENLATVTTAFTCCVCGFRFEIGEEYLIYAYRQDGVYRTSICDRTKLLGDASEDLEHLGHLAPIWTAPQCGEDDPA